jgi:hypothetical protein
MGTSRDRPDPVRAWATSIWHLYRAYDKKPALGRRGESGDRPGRFQKVLIATASPLKIKFNWLTLQRQMAGLKKIIGT